MAVSYLLNLLWRPSTHCISAGTVTLEAGCWHSDPLPLVPSADILAPEDKRSSFVNAASELVIEVTAQARPAHQTSWRDTRLLGSLCCAYEAGATACDRPGGVRRCAAGACQRSAAARALPAAVARLSGHAGDSRAAGRGPDRPRRAAIDSTTSHFRAGDGLAFAIYSRELAGLLASLPGDRVQVSVRWTMCQLIEQTRCWRDSARCVQDLASVAHRFNCDAVFTRACEEALCSKALWQGGPPGWLSYFNALSVLAWSQAVGMSSLRRVAAEYLMSQRAGGVDDGMLDSIAGKDQGLIMLLRQRRHYVERMRQPY